MLIFRYLHKKIFSSVLLLGLLSSFFSTQTIQACDLCGCGVGFYYLGMLPEWNKHFVGIRYRNATYDSHLGMGRLFETQENFHTIETMWRFYPHKKVQVLGILPYHVNFQTTNSGVLQQKGIGDVLLMANYEVFQKQDTTRLIKHELRIGGGIKFRTGYYRYNPDDLGQVANPNFQLGTGSNDALFTLLYTLRFAKSGLQMDLNYKVNGSNSREYRFGNRLTGNAMWFWVKNKGLLSLMPYVGVYGEHSAWDTERVGEHLRQNSNTGGWLVAPNVGLNAFVGHFSWGFLYQQPLWQNLAQEQIKANARWQAQVAYLF
jgi:hypothetical protein